MIYKIKTSGHDWGTIEYLVKAKTPQKAIKKYFKNIKGNSQNIGSYFSLSIEVYTDKIIE